LPGRSKSFYAREAILTHLEDIEDAYLGKKALDEGVSARPLGTS
jgi:predicted DNA-binding protein